MRHTAPASSARRWRLLGFEATLAFFGIYGTGWLLAGEKRTGALLLGGSLLLQLAALLTVADMQGWIRVYLLASIPFHVIFLSVSLVLLARKTAPPRLVP